MARYGNVIHWFRRDLRLTDNRSLAEAVNQSGQVLPAYISSEWTGDHHWTGPARQAFLCGCLESLARNIDHIGGTLIFRRGGAVEELRKLIDESRAEALYWNRDPDPFGKEMEERVKSLCREKGIDFHDFQDVVLHEPDEILTGAGNPYKVYTPYSRSWFPQPKMASVATVKEMQSPATISPGEVPSVEDWGLGYQGELVRMPGERAARERLDKAIGTLISGYGESRNDPAADLTSHLGADLRWGTLSVREVFHRAERVRQESRSEAERNSIHDFQKQLAWREFFMSILGHFPEVLETDFNQDWRGLRWDDPGEPFERWKEGRTGFPIVDAGMRQLRETGYMHNRVRMITAMFLTKDLHVHWRQGEAHFMRELLDGEIANNNGGWQWSAGTGADAAPYFRIQNPWTQTERFDPAGEYIRRWVPELEGVDAKRLRKPPENGRPLSSDYVLPIVDHRAERDETLARFKSHRAGG